MRFAREKRLLVGWMALLLPLPLPLNDVLEWPALLVYAGFVVYFLQRAEEGRPILLSNTALNLLGLVYLPILALDLRQSLLSDQVVRALLHLLLFLLVVKLYSLKQENEKWHVMAAIFFLFVAAMATSSHMTVIFYLLGATAVCLYSLARLAHLSMLGAAGREPAQRRRFRDAEGRVAPLPRLNWAGWTSLLLVVALTIPVFAAMPRLRKPWVLGRGAGNIGLARTTGFSDQVNLSSLTSGIRQNREVVVRVTVDGELTEVSGLRLKGASFETYDFDSNTWARPYQQFRSQPADDDGIVRLVEAPVTRRWQIRLEPLDSPSLMLPLETAAVGVGRQVQGLALGPGGDLAHRSLSQRSEPVDYEVLLTDRPVVAAHDGTDGLGVAGLSAEVRQLAAQVMGDGSTAERVRRLERWLVEGFEYTTDFAGREGERPIEEFLFQHRSGHCELFATSMVLMLRSQDVPARLATGFLGAEVNKLEGQLIVRQNNAHAWVEALTEDGWGVYDPTPPAGRPSAPSRGFRLFAQQLYDFVVYRFDRYVLTYSSDDQQSVFQALKDRVAAMWDAFWPDEPDEELAPDATLQTVVQGEAAPGFSLWTSREVRLGGLIVFVLLVMALVLWQRRGLGVEDAYRKLRVGLEEMGFGVDDTTAPLDLRERLLAEVPGASGEASRLMDLYLRVSWAEQRLDRASRRQVRPLLGSVLEQAGKVSKARRKARGKTGRRK